jgi:hypothetical protein
MGVINDNYKSNAKLGVPTLGPLYTRSQDYKRPGSNNSILNLLEKVFY